MLTAPGTGKATQRAVSLVAVDIDDREIDAVGRVLRSGQLAQGPEVAAFEAEFAAVTGAAFAVAVNSGTAANHAGLAALGIEPGEDVVTTPFTFAATSTPILMQRAVPRFVDIDPHTFNVDLAVATAAYPDARAAVLVDLFGLPYDRSGSDAFRARGGRVLEDACQAVGATRDGREAGRIGDVSSFSFYATKNISTGEGGMLVTDDADIAKAARRFRHHGQGDRYEYVSLGYNYRMTDVLAAIGRVQLGRLPEIAARRRANAATYDRELATVPGLTTPFVPAAVQHAYHQYSILIDAERTANGANRDAVRSFLAERGIATGIYYPTPLHLNALFKQFGYGPGDFPVAERVATQILALPIHPKLAPDDLAHVVATLRAALGAPA